ncbi:unnamed protein product [Bemisia tabaci]|uniref:Uncharacterized protein n=2 Tax=Bemisia tabaci TaxID=7038 RepID=A0AAI8UV24_BEMTA|nr:unnamed protein product [Bemisia tabaci]
MRGWIFWCVCLKVIVVRGSRKNSQGSLIVPSIELSASQGSSADRGTGLYSGLIQNLNEKLDQVQNVPTYRFTKELWLEKVRDRPVESAAYGATYHATFGSVVKKGMDLFKSHSLLWNFAPGLDLKVGSETSGRFDATVQPSAIDTRTFGRFGMRRRIVFALLPIMYKMGVITTLLVGLTVFTLKGLTIGVVLLFLTLTSTIHKLKYGWSYGAHTVAAAPAKSVHIHIHSGGGGPGLGFEHAQYGQSVHAGGGDWERHALPPFSGPDIQYHHPTTDGFRPTTAGSSSYYYH